MMMVADDRALERREIEDMLPWHAAGNLSQRESQRVEEALKRDPELARFYEVVREELAATIHLNESLGAPSPRAMEKLFAAIDAEPKRAPAAASFFNFSLTEFFASLAPRTLAYGGIAAALLIVAQAGVITTGYLGSKTGTYEAASAPRTAAVAPAAEALIRFAPQATSADVTKLLETYKASVVDGPLPGGLYRVRVAVAGQPNTELARVVEQMRTDPAVGFVAPATK